MNALQMAVRQLMTEATDITLLAGTVSANQILGCVRNTPNREMLNKLLLEVRLGWIGLGWVRLG